MSKYKIKNDIIFICAVLVLAFLIWMFFRYGNQNTGNIVVVSQNGEVIGRYDLSMDQDAIIAYGEEYNLLMISSGDAFISDADCPDGLCIKQKAISRNGESIICLPHKLVIQIEAKEEGELDAVTY